VAGPTAQSPRCRGDRLLPNLTAVVPDHIDVKQEGPAAAPQFLLVFQSAVANDGAGPLTLVGERPGSGQHDLMVRQLIQCSAGPPESHPGAGVMGYENEPPYPHWHVLGFDLFELRALAPGTAPRRSRKVGFCPADVARVVLPFPYELAHSPPSRVFDDYLATECAAGNPVAVRVVSGISVGFADIYAAYVEGQYIDLTGLRAGTYRLINEANPQGSLLEQGYDDDVAGVEVAISWPGGPQSAPKVALGPACLGRRACRA